MHARNLIICSDGTSQLWGSKDSNVVRLVRHCAKDETQLVFYDPGVGTDEFFPPTSWASKLRDYGKTLSGLAFGRGIYENIAQCYQFLVDNYREGDRIFLFGFSRGAFTVRSVSGLVRLFGIVRPDARPLLPLMLRAYFASKERSKDRHALADDLKQHFTDATGRAADIHFIGVWDTVASVGGLVSERISANAVVKEKPIGHIRHAVSVGEYRAPFAPRLYDDEVPPGAACQRDGTVCWSDKNGRKRSFQQRWFRGVHIDVGGGSDEVEQELAYKPLRWMVQEAEACGLTPAPNATFERTGCSKVGECDEVHDQALHMPLWALLGLQRRPPPEPTSCDPSLGTNLGDSTVEIGRGLASPRSRRWLAASSTIALACYGLATWITSRIPEGAAAARSSCSLSRGVAWLFPEGSPRDLADLQLCAPFVSAAQRARFADHLDLLGRALGADVLLNAAYTVLLCVLSVHAVRALRDLRPSSERVHRALRYALQLPLLGAAGLDLLEDALTVPFLEAGTSFVAWLLALCSSVKLLCLVLLLGLLFGAFLRRLLRGQGRAALRTSQVG